MIDSSKNKKPYISSPFGWGLDGGSKRIYRAIIPLGFVYTVYIIRLVVKQKIEASGKKPAIFGIPFS